MAGARTSAQMRPARTASPPMPGLVWPTFTPLSASKLGEQANTPAESNLPPGLTEASSPRERSAHSKEAAVSLRAETGADQNLRSSSTMPGTRAEPIRKARLLGREEQAGFEPSSVIRVPKGLRANTRFPPMPLSHDTHLALPVQDVAPTVSTAVVSPGVPSQQMEQQRESLEPLPVCDDPVRAESDQPQSSRSTPEPSLDDVRPGGIGAESQSQVAQKPESSRRTHAKVPKQEITSHTHGGDQLGTDSGQSHLAIVQPNAAIRLTKEEPVDRNAHVKPARKEMISETDRSDEGFGASGASAPAQPMKQENALHATVRPVPERQAAPATVPGASGGRQSRITIGRIDVQVNNHPPVPTTAPPSRSVAPLPSDILEARFLNRFWMKP